MQSPVSQRKRSAIAGASAAVMLILGGIYTIEGGYSNNPADPGAATRYGVTAPVARAAGYTGDMRFFPKHCDGSARACADGVYVPEYIVRPGYMPLVTIEPALADKLVNTAVNMGPARPNTWLRVILGRPVSGASLAPADIAAYVARRTEGGSPAVCNATLVALGQAQEREYRTLVRQRPALGQFLRGWVARARNLHPGGLECVK